jgi:hypothetical protein
MHVMSKLQVLQAIEKELKPAVYAFAYERFIFQGTDVPEGVIDGWCMLMRVKGYAERALWKLENAVEQ